MSVYKRYDRKRVKRGDKDYAKGTWYAEGQCNGQRYHPALPGVKTAEEARAAEEEIRRKIRNGEWDQSRDKSTFADYVDTEYLPYCESNLSSAKQKVYECQRLKTYFKDIALKQITPSKCEGFKRWRLAQFVRCQKCENEIPHKCDKQPVSKSTVNRELTTLKSILHRAEADRKINDNPMRFVPMFQEPPGPERFLSSDERERLIEVLKDNYQLWAIVVIALLTGWRKNQILHLRACDIVLDEKKVWILMQKQKQKGRKKVIAGDAVLSILLSLAEVRDEWLFVNPSGNRLVEFNPAWWKALEKAEIERFRFHDLRHSFATSLLDNNVNEFAVQHALGHSRLQTTQGYAHVKDEYLRRGLNALSAGEIPLHPTIITPTDKVM